MISSDFLLLQISGLPNNTFLTDLMTMVEAEVRNYGLIREMTIGKFIMSMITMRSLVMVMMKLLMITMVTSETRRDKQ